MSTVKALKDFLDPYASVIHVVGTEFDLPDENLVTFAVEMGHLELVEEPPPPEENPAKSSKSAKPTHAETKPTKAELSSGFGDGGKDAG